MNRLLLFVISLSCLCTYPKHDIELFLHAHDLFHVGKFQEARELYEQIQHPDAQVLINVGVTHYNQKHYVDALWNWKRAAHHTLTYTQALFLEECMLKVYKQLQLPEPSKAQRYLDRCMYVISLYILQIIMMVLMLLFLIQAAMFVVYPSKKRAYRIVLLMIITISMHKAVVYKTAQISTGFYGIIKHASEPLYNGPGTTFKKKRELPLGTLVKIKQSDTILEGDMIPVYSDKQSGWVARSGILII